jgi:hypothetical protein
MTGLGNVLAGIAVGAGIVAGAWLVAQPLSQGIFQIVPPNSGDIADFGRYDTTTIDTTVKPVVSVEHGPNR